MNPLGRVSKTYGNSISIQVGQIVRIINSLDKAYPVSPPPLELNIPQEWALCHVGDVANLYLSVLRRNLFETSTPAKPGIYFAENGVFSWDEPPKKLLAGLEMQGDLTRSGEKDIEGMSKVLGVRPAVVRVQLAGR